MTPQQRPAELRIHRLELALLPETRAVGRVDQYEPGRRDGHGQPCNLASLETEDLGEAVVTSSPVSTVRLSTTPGFGSGRSTW